MRSALLCLLATVSSAIADCGPSPISIPIADVELSNSKTKRGILGEVGTPAQNISFKINTYLNDTWIYNATQPFCANDTTASQCLTTRGGVYNTEESTSFVSQSNVSAAGGDPSDVARTLGTHIWYNAWATDNFTVGDATLKDYAIGMPGFDIAGPYDTHSLLGLGHNSTLLERLRSDGRIASRSWSYWWGVDNSQSRSAIDGQFVLGGYDAAKVKGTPFTQPLQNASSNCQSGMTITFTNMLLNFPNGTSVDLNPSSVLTACIEPDFPAIMTIPAEPYFWHFENVTETRSIGRSQGTNFWNPVYSPSNVYAGDLQFQIQGGPAIDIPNDVLIVPDQYVDSVGNVRSNSSAAVLLLGPLDGINANDIPKVGLEFFSAAYLTVNLDNGTWSIWPANPTADTRLVAIGDDGCESVANQTNPSNNHTSDVPANQKTQGWSTGDLVGVVVGCVCGVIAFVALVLVCIRKRRKARRDAGAVPEPNSGDYSSHQHMWRNEMIYAHEVDSKEPLRTELPINRDPVEMPQSYARDDKCGHIKRDPVELPTGYV